MDTVYVRGTKTDAAAARAEDPIPNEATAARLAREGRGLSAQQVNELEDRLKDTPDDLPARARLLGYYFATAIRVAGPEATRAARRRHILWLIEHHPGNDITMLSEFTIDPAGHPLADAEATARRRSSGSSKSIIAKTMSES